MDSNSLLPLPYINKMEQILPDHLSIDDLIEYSHRPLRRAVRVNTLKISIDDFKQRAENHGWLLSEIPWCNEGFWIETQDKDETYSLGNSAEHLGGLCYIQEASSMMPVTALFHFFNPSASSILLDAAAAPGSKTTQIAARLNNKGLVIANEYSSSRIKMLHANIQRCGIKNVALTHFDAAIFGKWLPETFDAILLDAPCSGEGTIRKDKSAMKNWSQESIDSISKMQKDLISSAFDALKPGGIMVYSTCTLSHEENQDILYYLQQKHDDKAIFLDLKDLFPDAQKAITKEGFLHIWPQVYDSEGFFVAALQKTASSSASNDNKRPAKLPFNKALKQDEQNLHSYLRDQFGINHLDGMLFQRDKEFWLFPGNIEPLMTKIRFSRLGIKIAEQYGKGKKSGFKVMHEFARCYGDLSTQDKITLTPQQANEFYQGKDLRGVDCKGASGEIFVYYNGNIIGIGKALNNRIKNNLPRDLIHNKSLFNK